MGKKQFALIGCPLGHSISPQIHAELMKKAGVDGDYTLCEIKPEELEGADYLADLDGYNVTIPHKTNIIPTLSKLDKKAALYGAVNTVKNENGVSRHYVRFRRAQIRFRVARLTSGKQQGPPAPAEGPWLSLAAAQSST